MARYRQLKQKVIDDYQAPLEFKRRKAALRACNVHRRLRTDGCTFDEMLALTNPLEREDAIRQYAVERQRSKTQQVKLQMAAVQSIPWFVALSIDTFYLSSIGTIVAIAAVPPMMDCDPAFEAEIPSSRGVLLKIGHFDEVRGVTHIEI